MAQQKRDGLRVRLMPSLCLVDDFAKVRPVLIALVPLAGLVSVQHVIGVSMVQTRMIGVGAAVSEDVTDTLDEDVVGVRERLYFSRRAASSDDAKKLEHVDANAALATNDSARLDGSVAEILKRDAVVQDEATA